MRRDHSTMGDASESLRDKSILIAGCGADGSHAANTLAFMTSHIENVSFTLADPDIYELGNLGIQLAYPDQLGMNKAEATAANILRTKPDAIVAVVDEGVTPENVTDLAESHDYIVDATDVAVTGLAQLLHDEANDRGVPVVVPWSLGNGGAMIACTQKGDFKRWGMRAEEIADKYELDDIKDIMRWLVDLPHGFTRQSLGKFVRGELPTPSAYLGARAGGDLAAQWIIRHAHAIKPLTVSFPDAYITTNNMFKTPGPGSSDQHGSRLAKTETFTDVRNAIERIERTAQILAKQPR